MKAVFLTARSASKRLPDKCFLKIEGMPTIGSVPYHEPAVHGNVSLCRVAESIQPHIMQFKTNYRSIELAKQKAEALQRTIKKWKQL